MIDPLASGAVPDGGRSELILARVLQRQRNVARAMAENGTSEEALRGWQAFAGWLRAGMPDEPDVRGPVPDGEDVPARLDAAAAVLEDDLLISSPEELRRVAQVLRQLVTPEVRAAVAAALTRPTGAQP